MQPMVVVRFGGNLWITCVKPVDILWIGEGSKSYCV